VHTSVSTPTPISVSVSVSIALYISVYIVIDIGTMRKTGSNYDKWKLSSSRHFAMSGVFFDGNFCCSVKTKAGKKQSVGVHFNIVPFIYVHYIATDVTEMATFV